MQHHQLQPCDRYSAYKKFVQLHPTFLGLAKTTYGTGFFMLIHNGAQF